MLKGSNRSRPQMVFFRRTLAILLRFARHKSLAPLVVQYRRDNGLVASGVNLVVTLLQNFRKEAEVFYQGVQLLDQLFKHGPKLINVGVNPDM